MNDINFVDQKEKDIIVEDSTSQITETLDQYMTDYIDQLFQPEVNTKSFDILLKMWQIQTSFLLEQLDYLILDKNTSIEEIEDIIINFYKKIENKIQEIQQQNTDIIDKNNNILFNGFRIPVNMTVDRLKKVGSKKTIDYFLKYILTEQPVFSNKKVIETMYEIDKDYFVQKIKDFLEENPDNINLQLELGSLLSKLEKRPLTINENGLFYLGTTYNLGEYNSSQYYAKVLSAYNEIGIFDKNNELQKIFYPSYIKEKNTEIEIPTLFDPETKINVDPEKTEEENFFIEFKQGVYNKFQDIFDDKDIPYSYSPTRIDFFQLSVLEQYAVFQYFKKEKTPDEILFLTKIFHKKNIKIYGLILKTLASYHIDNDIQRTITKIIEYYEKDEMKKIFSKYSEIIRQINLIESYLQSFSKIKIVDRDTTQQITTELLKRATQLLYDFANNNTLSPEEFVNKLESFNKDILIFCSIFKTVFKGEKQVDFSEIKGLDFERKNIQDLTDEEKQEILKIAEANWQKRGESGKKVIVSLQETLERSNDSEFHLLKKDGKIIGLVRFDKMRDSKGNIIEGKKYAGSLNIDPAYRGSAIGEALLANTIDNESKQSILEATTSPLITAGTDYVEKRGFNISGVIPNYLGSADTFFTISLDKKNNEQMKTRQKLSKEKIIELYENIYKDKNIEDMIKTQEEIIVLKGENQKNLPETLMKIQTLTNHGYLGTRYFYDQEDENTRYYVFEKNNKDEKEVEIEQKLAA